MVFTWPRGEAHQWGGRDVSPILSLLSCPADPPPAQQRGRGRPPGWAQRSDLLGLLLPPPLPSAPARAPAHLSDGHLHPLGMQDAEIQSDSSKSCEALLVAMRLSLLVSGPSAWVLGDCCRREGVTRQLCPPQTPRLELVAQPLHKIGVCSLFSTKEGRKNLGAGSVGSGDLRVQNCRDIWA